MSIDPIFTKVEVNRLKANRPAWAETANLDRDHVTGEVIAVIYEGPVNSVVIRDVNSAKRVYVPITVQASRVCYPDKYDPEIWVSITKPEGWALIDMDLDDALKVADVIRKTVTHVRANGGMAEPRFENTTDALSAIVASLLESMGIKINAAAKQLQWPAWKLENLLSGRDVWNVEEVSAVAKVVGLPMGRLLEIAQENTISTVHSPTSAEDSQEAI